MNLVDTNGVSYILTTRLSLKENYFLVPDVSEEVEMTQLVHGKKVPHNVLEIIASDEFDEVIYLNHYKDMLNKHDGKSFFNMTGFGDISILATVLTLLDVYALQKTERLFDPTEPITIFTNDTGLTKRIAAEFVSKNVLVRPISDIK
ncbi:MAG: hypothetical protein KBC62_02380 [Candidatus Pacebacteria bacterium]|nr:hypothetical protein [Candidatus Paceibacterota bacterium]